MSNLNTKINRFELQLIYSVGRQQQVDAGDGRWKMIESIIDIVKENAAGIAQRYENDVFSKSTIRRSVFPEFRLLSHQPFSTLSNAILDEWFKLKSFHKNDLELIQ